ncbi:MAG: thiol:disulfide interchange protein [Betaproteobacteria bacterium HGW-Betaproteobacteria-13]|jgi:thiol:disulfide interchange protein DsbD|uniref:Thiol:disulfide interchange protein DsbD n=1 Tax=Parazoarcus communis TaxID=41977 RepID=A0A2U8GZX1_9RHOO|nr:protein-disulfide reductase DsbD [Parazoarcus communis]AWI79267.1 thiol:disulfide interchange protein [Parazoarcus communis]PKO81930.1 MAG: thiol:disulfide interchange protein [Betaproteobacteria bacterium HGW-Betaproteobacteria-13]
MQRLLILLALLASLFSLPGQAADPIEPEKAFAMTARALDPQTVEVVFDVAPDYYLYGSKFRFDAEPASVVLGEPDRPPGKIKQDEFFGEVETYRGELRILLPVTAPADVKRFVLHVSSQGCWDGGICYPPTPQSADIDLTTSAAPAGNSLLQRALDQAPNAASTPAATASGAASAVSGDESGRIAGLLRNASIPLVLASFFGFGLLLAFTPCTFPMIPILSGIIVGHGHHISRGRAFMLSLAYVLGMAVTYAAAGVAAGLTGTLLSAALQNVWVLSSFALVFVALSLSMFGFYELQLPSSLQSKLADTASHNKGGHLGGVAVMGVLSALIVGPCVAAPLAGALLYIAQTGDAVLGGFALFVMALGMGMPLLAVGLAARSVLPRTGPWMEGIKKAFGVLLLAVAVWMLMPVLPALASMLAWAALLLFSGIFLHAIDPLPPGAKGWQRFWKGVGVMLLIGGAAMLVGAMAGSRDPLQPLAVLRAEAAATAPAPAFEKVGSIAELDARLAATDRPVMLDFYADWCVSCKEMERFTFSDPQVAGRMSQMLLLKADVTDNNDEHKALLKRFGLFGPPGIIFFDPAGKERDGLRVVGFMPAQAFAEVLDRAR